MADDGEYGLNDAVRDILNKKIKGSNGTQGQNNNEQLSQRQKRQNLKRIKKRVAKEERKDPFIKNKIIQNSAHDKASTNPNVKENLKNFNNTTKQKTQLGRKVQNAKSYEDAQKLQQEYNEADKKQTKASFPLKISMLQEDLKRALEGPSGWIKNAKGCLGPSVICLSIIGGGVLALILSVI